MFVWLRSQSHNTKGVDRHYSRGHNNAWVYTYTWKMDSNKPQSRTKHARSSIDPSFKMYWWHTFPGYFHDSSWKLEPILTLLSMSSVPSMNSWTGFWFGSLANKVPIRRGSKRERERESSRCGCLSKVRVAICVGCVRSSTGVTDAHSSVWIADFFFIFFLFHIKLHTRQWRAARQWKP